MPFTCTICEEQSTRICIACTKDTCGNHLCEKCRRCSDCCDCEIHIEVSEEPHAEPLHYYPVEGPDDYDEDLEDEEPVEARGLADGPREPEPHPHPTPDPDPAPEPGPLPIPGFPSPEENN